MLPCAFNFMSQYFFAYLKAFNIMYKYNFA